MVKCINPLFSNSARGRVGGLVYQTGKYGQICRTHIPQHGRPSTAQLQQNYFFGVASDAWRELTQEQKEVYNLRAKGLVMTGYNLYIQENIQHP